jgi:hypothetical protein
MGNIKELPRYHKKAQHIEQKLTQAAERVRKNKLYKKKRISCFWFVFYRLNNLILKKIPLNGIRQVIHFVNKH